ncbi:elongation factor G [Botrimarina sp.]|uniref:elongation factor G n=1 Tax=Botrimarina sp. TaxID=2795802 RepID=UPI0032ED3E48
MTVATSSAKAAIAANVPDPESIRVLCLCGHSGSGKTTLCERLLYDAGVVTRMGDVEHGTTFSDHTPEERQHKHSLQPSFLHFDHEGHHVCVIDTPGMADFIGHTIACFPAVESVVVVIDATKGIESETRRLMRIATQRNLPRMILVNKIDAPDVDLGKLTERIRNTFGQVCLPINMPSPDCERVVDVFETDAHDATAFGSAEEAHTQIVEQVVEVDEGLMAEYLEVGAEGLDPARVHDAFEQALREGHLVPIVYASASSGAGIANLLHVTASLLPSPLEGNPRPFVRGDRPMSTEFDADKPTVAHVFRVTTEPHLGKLGVFRVHQGTVRARSEMYIDGQRKPLRVGHVMRLQGKEHVETDSIGPGEIGAVSKLEDIHFDGVLHDGATPEDPPHIRPLPLPKPMYSLAVELKSHSDETKFSTAIQRLQEEDPCFVMQRIAATKQTVLRGLGELHLRVILEKLQSQHGIELETSPPKIAYKETITTAAEGHCRHKKQTGGAGQFGEVYLRVAPLPDDHPTGFEFENKTVGGAIPRQFMPAIEKGVRQALDEGAIAGYPVCGVRVEVYDGKHHDVDSKEIAFITAGKKAFIDAVGKAQPVLLEPFAAVEVVAPLQHVGDITSDLSTRRGRVSDSLVSDQTCVVRAVAPLAELREYATQLRSLTGGAGAFTMDYSHDEPAPRQTQDEVVAAYRANGEH